MPWEPKPADHEYFERRNNIRLPRMYMTRDEIFWGEVEYQPNEGWWFDAPNNSFGWSSPTLEQYPSLNAAPIIPGAKYRMQGTVITLSGSNPQVRVRLGTNLVNTFSILSTGAFDETHVAGTDLAQLRFIIDDNTTTDAVRVEDWVLTLLEPAVINSVSISGSDFLAGQALTALASVEGSPTPALTYQWKRDGVNIGGATGQQYTRLWTDQGKELSVEVRATNSEGTDIATAVQAVPYQNVEPDYGFNPGINGENAVYYDTAQVGYFGLADLSIGDQTVSYFGSFGANYFNLRTVGDVQPTDGDTVEVSIQGFGTQVFNWSGGNSRYEGVWTGIQAYLVANVGSWLDVTIDVFDYSAPIITQQIPKQTVSMGQVLRIPLNNHFQIPGDEPEWARRTELSFADLGGGNPILGGVFEDEVFEEGVFI